MDGFGVRLLRARRLAGWTQQQLATRAGLDRTTVCTIEAGRREPSFHAATALEAALREALPDVSLIRSLTVPAATMVAEVDRRQFGRHAAGSIVAATFLPMIDLERLGAPTLDARQLDDWEALTGIYARLRASEPPRELLPKLDLHLRTLESRRFASDGGAPELRSRLLTLVAGTAALCGWVAQLAELRQDARIYLARGEEIAREVGDRETLALLLMLRADLLSAVPTGGQEGFPAAARRQLEEALTLTSPATAISLRVPIVMRAAEEAAYVGDESEAMRLLERGLEDEALPGRPRTCLLRPIWLGWAAMSFRGSALVLLGRPREALEALGPIESPLPNHRPLHRTDLAAAYAQTGDLDQAARVLADAIELAIQNGHANAGRRIAGVRRRELARWTNEPVVQELDERLTALL